MILLVFGEDKYRLNKRIGELREKTNDPSGLNVITFEGTLDFNKLKNEAETLPFLADRKVIFIKDIFSTKNKDLIKSLEKWLPEAPKETDLIFVEEEAKPATIKLFEKLGKIETYSLLKPFELSRWIQDKTKESGGEISPKDAERLGVMVGPDLWRLENEIQKLISFDKKITEKNIEEMVDEGFFDSIFSLMDAISEKNSKKALTLLNKFLDHDENELYLLSMLTRQIRNLIIVKDLFISGLKETEIVSKTNLHPYVVKKTLSQSKNFEMEKLLRMHNDLLITDKNLKGSGLDPKTVLSRLLISFTS